MKDIERLEISLKATLNRNIGEANLKEKGQGGMVYGYDYDIALVSFIYMGNFLSFDLCH